MFEYFKLKAEIKKLTENIIWINREKGALLVEKERLKSQIANYLELEAERKTARETQRQKMLIELEQMFLRNPHITILDAIRFYSDKPFNSYSNTTAQPQHIYSSLGGLIPHGGGF